MLHVITGPMFSGKSTELIRILQRNNIAKKWVVAFKPSTDDRYSSTKVMSHTGMGYDCVPVANSGEIAKYIDANPVTAYSSTSINATDTMIGIDEANLFDAGLPDLIIKLAKQFHVVVSGLSTDFNGVPFENINKILPFAEKITKLTAICTYCGEEANYNPLKKFVISTERLQVGGEEMYEAVCMKCMSSQRGICLSLSPGKSLNIGQAPLTSPESPWYVRGRQTFLYQEPFGMLTDKEVYDEEIYDVEFSFDQDSVKFSISGFEGRFSGERAQIMQ